MFQGRTSELKKLNKATVKKYIFQNEVRNLKNSLYFRRELAKLENKKNHIFCLLWENFQLYAQKKKVSYSFLYNGPKFSKSKYFLIIIIKHFFSFYKFLFYTQQAFVFHLLRDCCNVHGHPVAFFIFFFFKNILIPFTSFFMFVVFLYFLDNIWLINI